jgi:hypothetical protein
MQPLDWITLALGVVLTFTGIGLAVRFARDDQDAFIHYVYTVVLGMGGGFLAASIPGWFQVDGSVAGIAIRATSGFAVFAFVVVIYYLIRTRQRVARVHAAAAWRARQNAGIKSGCTAITNCNDDPIVVCTSLPTGIAVSVFESACRDLAEVMCASVVRSIEEYCRTKTKGRTVTPSFPSRLDDWKAWAKSSSTGSKPGLPQHCLDHVGGTRREHADRYRETRSRWGQPRRDRRRSLHEPRVRRRRDLRRRHDEFRYRGLARRLKPRSNRRLRTPEHHAPQ